jgi:hypothetical protein
MNIENVNTVADLRKLVSEELATIPVAVEAAKKGNVRDVELAGLIAAADVSAVYVGEKAKDPVDLVNEINKMLDGNKRAFKNSIDVIRETRMTFVRETTEITKAMDGFLAKKKDVESLLASVQKLIACMNDPALKGFLK